MSISLIEKTLDRYQDLFNRNKVFAEYLLTNKEYNYDSTISILRENTEARNAIYIDSYSINSMIEHFDLRGKAEPIDQVDLDNLPKYIYNEHVILHRETGNLYIYWEVPEGELDIFLAFLPNGQDESLFECKKYKIFKDAIIERKLAGFVEQLAELKASHFDERIKEKYNEINRLKQNIFEKYNEINQLNRDALNNNFVEAEFLDMFKSLHNHKMIDSISVEHRTIYIRTKELPLSYIVNEHIIDNPTLRTYTNEEKQAIKERRLYIDPYQIEIKLSPQRLNYEMYSLGDYTNKHWSQYQCLGNFEPHLIDLRQDYKIVPLIQMLIQYLQTVDLADIAGKETIKGAKIKE